MYIPRDPHLMLHMPISWWPASQPVNSRHASAEVGLGSDSKGQSEQDLNCKDEKMLVDSLPPPIGTSNGWSVHNGGLRF